MNSRASIRLVDDIHKADGPGRDAASRVDHRSRGAQILIRHSGSAARLMNDRNVLRVFHYSFDRVGYIEDEAGRKLAFRLTGVDEAGSVRNEFASKHSSG